MRKSDKWKVPPHQLPEKFPVCLNESVGRQHEKKNAGMEFEECVAGGRERNQPFGDTGRNTKRVARQQQQRKNFISAVRHDHAGLTRERRDNDDTQHTTRPQRHGGNNLVQKKTFFSLIKALQKKKGKFKILMKERHPFRGLKF